MPLTKKQQEAVNKMKSAAEKAAARKSFEAQNVGRSKPTPKASRSARPQSSRQPRSFGHIYSPLDPRPVPSAHYQGEAVPITTMYRAVSDTTNSKVFCVAIGGTSATLGWYIDNGATPAPAAFNGNFLTSAAYAGGPDGGRAMKLGVSIKNITKNLDVGGRVHVLVTDRRTEIPTAPSVMTQANVNTLISEIVSHPSSRSFGGQAFTGEGKHFYSTPRDITEYTSFLTWAAPETLDGYASRTSLWTGTSGQPLPMSVIWVVMHSTSTANDYELSVRGSFYTRWPLDHVTSSLATKIPTAPAESLNLAAEAGKAAGELGVGAIALAGAKKFLGPVARSAANLMRGAGAGVVAGAEEAEMLAPLLML